MEKSRRIDRFAPALLLLALIAAAPSVYRRSRPPPPPTRAYDDTTRYDAWRERLVRAAGRPTVPARESRTSPAWTKSPCETSARASYPCDKAAEPTPSPAAIQAMYDTLARRPPPSPPAAKPMEIGNRRIARPPSQRRPSQEAIDRFLWQQEAAKEEFRRAKRELEGPAASNAPLELR